MIELYLGDCLDVLKTMPDNSIHCCVTSPPYWGLRDYGHDGQIGLEDTPEEYVNRMVEVFREVKRVLRNDGTLWLNLGDSYANFGSNGICGKTAQVGNTKSGQQKTTNKLVSRLKLKDLVGIPWRVAFALQADGWWLRQDIIWHKPNPMPESVTDRCTKSHEYVFLLTKSKQYFYDAEAISEPLAESSISRLSQNVASQVGTTRANGGMKTNGNFKSCGDLIKGKRNRRSVWTITTKPYSGAHFAVMPMDLVEPCIKAGTSQKGCCPTCGAPWERVVNSSRVMRHELPKDDPNYRPARYSRKSSGTDDYTNGGAQAFSKTTTIGWIPTCTCGGDPVPCTVLDPFSGSGTVGVVSTNLKQNYIGIELNPDYILLSQQRLNVVYDKPVIYNLNKE